MAKIKSPATVGGIAFVVAAVGIIIANQFVAGFSIGIKTFIFIVLLGFALFLGFRFAGEARQAKEIGLFDALIYGGLLFGIGWVVLKFNLAPEFSVVINNLASVIGLM